MNECVCALIPSTEHSMSGHPESPDRFAHMAGWAANPPCTGLTFISPQPATHEEILRVHSPEMLLSLEIACSLGLHKIESAPTYVNSHSCESMRLMAGAVLQLERLIASGHAKNGFAIGRPPGHHAGCAKPMGFCLLNNTAVAVADALVSECKKVAVIDFDGHHANGTQEIFLNEERVGLFSMHQEGIYPNDGAMSDQVMSRIINLPLPAGTGDEIFPLVTQFILESWLEKFQPDMIFVSAGFDGHFADPITGLGFTTAGYYNFAKQLKGLAQKFSEGKLLFVLEGGYDPLALEESVQAVLCALVDQKVYPDSFGKNPFMQDSIASRVKLIAYVHNLI